MKLLVVAQVAPEGGAFTALKNLLDAQESMGADIAILLDSQAEIQQSAKEDWDKRKIKIIRGMHRWEIFRRFVFSPIFDFFFVLPAIFKFRPDAIHFVHTDPGTFAGALLLQVPQIHSLHSIPQRPLRIWNRYLYKLLGKHKLFHTDSISTRDTACAMMGIAKQNTTVIHNCVNTNFLVPATGPKEMLILTSGLFLEYKNPSVWLDSVELVQSRIPRVTFVWIGDGPLRPVVQEEIIKRKLSALLPGFEQDIRQWYRRAQIYFHPSRLESHGIAVVEAMACGLPCVVSDASGLKESVSDSETGFICSMDQPAEFADKIILLLGDERKRVSLGSKGRERAVKEFSIASYREKIKSLYERII